MSCIHDHTHTPCTVPDFMYLPRPGVLWQLLQLSSRAFHRDEHRGDGMI